MMLKRMTKSEMTEGPFSPTLFFAHQEEQLGLWRLPQATHTLVATKAEKRTFTDRKRDYNFIIVGEINNDQQEEHEQRLN